MECHAGSFEFCPEVGWLTDADNVCHVILLTLSDVEVQIGLTGCIHDEEAERCRLDIRGFGRKCYRETTSPIIIRSSIVVANINSIVVVVYCCCGISSRFIA